jgi:hypothetical protein
LKTAGAGTDKINSGAGEQPTDRTSQFTIDPMGRPNGEQQAGKFVVDTMRIITETIELGTEPARKRSRRGRGEGRREERGERKRTRACGREEKRLREREQVWR